MRRQLLLLALAATLSVGNALARAEDNKPAHTPPPPASTALDETERKFFYESLEKSDALASILGVVIGFGSGAYYAKSPDWGTGLLVTEVTTIGAWAAFGNGSNGAVFGGIFAVERILDGLAGALLAEDYNDDLHRAYGASRVRRGITMVPQSGPQGTGVLAAYSFSF
jgi:hypothetical protein